MYVYLLIFIIIAFGKNSIADNMSCLEMIENKFQFGEDFSENIQNLITENLNDNLSCRSFIEYLNLKILESTHSRWKELDGQDRRNIASRLLPLLKYQILNETNEPIKSIINAIRFENIFGSTEMDCAQRFVKTFGLSHSLSKNFIDHLNLSNYKECQNLIKMTNKFLFNLLHLINKSEWFELSNDNKEWILQSIYPIAYAGFQRSVSQIPLSSMFDNIRNLTLFDDNISLNGTDKSLSNKTTENLEISSKNSSMNYVYFLFVISVTIGLFYLIRYIGLIPHYERY